jgi:predicted aldo/keto reductase-like oxidoreductase
MRTLDPHFVRCAEELINSGRIHSLNLSLKQKLKAENMLDLYQKVKITENVNKLAFSFSKSTEF